MAVSQLLEFAVVLISNTSRASFVVGSARWLLCPLPKVASTLLKRLAVIADGREPYEGASLGETRPRVRTSVKALPKVNFLPPL